MPTVEIVINEERGLLGERVKTRVPQQVVPCTVKLTFWDVDWVTSMIMSVSVLSSMFLPTHVSVYGMQPAL